MATRKTRGLGKGLDALIPAKKSVNKSSEKTAIEVKKTPENAKKSENNTDKEIKSEIKIGNEDVKTQKTSSISNEFVADSDGKTFSDANTLVSDVGSNSNQVEHFKESKEKETVTAGQEIFVKISSVEPNRTQPRKQFNEDALIELSESIKQYGVIQPILVSKKPDYYEIIAGERRWRAAKLAGLKEIPVLIKEYTDLEIVEISLIENIQREDLNPIEEALAFKRLLEEFDLKQDEVAAKVSKSRTAVANSMRLLKLTPKVQQMLIDEMISSGHARALLAITDSDKQELIAMKVFDEKLSVRETEKLVKEIINPKPARKQAQKNSAEDAIFESLEERFKGIMGTKVNIHRKRNNKGKIEIEYYSKAELERIIDLFNSIPAES